MSYTSFCEKEFPPKVALGSNAGHIYIGHLGSSVFLLPEINNAAIRNLLIKNREQSPTPILSTNCLRCKTKGHYMFSKRNGLAITTNLSTVS